MVKVCSCFKKKLKILYVELKKKKKKTTSEVPNENPHVRMYLPHKWCQVSLESSIPQQSLECSCFCLVCQMPSVCTGGNEEQITLNKQHAITYSVLKVY